jgi:hypothetical protein
MKKSAKKRARKEANILSGNFDLSIGGSKKTKNDYLGGDFDMSISGKGKNKVDKVIFGSADKYLKL